MRRRQWSVTRPGVVLTGLSLLLAGCSASGGADASPSADATATDAASAASASPEPAPAPTTFEEVQAAYEACLRDEGSEPGLVPQDIDLTEVAAMVDATDEELAAVGTTREAVVAHAACWPAFLEALETVPLPEGDAGAAEPEPPADPELAAKLHEAVACLNERGWDFLEPGVETGALTMAARDPAFDWDDEAFLADQFECQQLAGMMG